jgi:hypothetical protein
VIRIAILTALAIALALAWARTVDASLGDRYPTDADGTVHVPSIDALSSRIAGRPFPVNCIPDPDDGNDARTSFDESQDTTTGVLTAEPATSTDMNGALCGALEPLLTNRQHYFHRYEVVVESVTLLIPPIPRPRGGQSRPARRMLTIEIWGSNRTERAANALLDVLHEAEHARITGPAPFVDDGHVRGFDEGIVECAAVHDLAAVVGGYPWPRWLKRNVLDAAMTAHASAPPEYLTVC